MATDAVSYDPVTVVPPELQPVVDNLVTEDDTPLDSVFQEKQQSLLTRTLHSSWPGPGEGRTFVAMANVGFYYSTHSPAIVPDVLVSLNVALPADVWPKRARSYCSWEYGKAPEVVVEIVSNRDGGEDSQKMSIYAVAGVRYSRDIRSPAVSQRRVGAGLPPPRRIFRSTGRAFLLSRCCFRVAGFGRADTRTLTPPGFDGWMPGTL